MSRLTEQEREALRDGLDEDGCYGFLNDHAATLAIIERIVAERERAAQVRALRDAVDELPRTAVGPTPPGNGAMDAGIYFSAIWLRDRADRIERDDR